MRRTIQAITALFALAILAACGLAVLYFGTGQGIAFGGGSTVLSSASKAGPVYAEDGWIRNSSPWPIEITSITVAAVHTSKAVPVYFAASQDNGDPTDKRPGWASQPVSLPYTLRGGALRYLGFALIPDSGKIASFASITVSYRGPFGFKFHKTYLDAVLVTASQTLPTGILAPDPATDSTSLDGWIVLLRSALAGKDDPQLAVVMGDTTNAKAAAFRAGLNGFKATDYLSAVTPVPQNPSEQTLIFYKTSLSKDALKPIHVRWAGYRWTVVG